LLVRSCASGEKRPVATKTMKGLLALWAKVLRVVEDQIGVDKSFFRLGGDTLSLIKLPGATAELDIAMSGKDVLIGRTFAALDQKLEDRTNMPTVEGNRVDGRLAEDNTTPITATSAFMLGKLGFSSLDDVEAVYPCVLA
jgi:hypothetical protein